MRRRKRSKDGSSRISPRMQGIARGNLQRSTVEGGVEFDALAEGLVETRETHGIGGLPQCRVDARYFLRDTALTKASDAIRTMVAAKQTDASKKLLDSIVLGNKSNFVNTRFIL